jgi:hypothetical protein
MWNKIFPGPYKRKANYDSELFEAIEDAHDEYQILLSQGRIGRPTDAEMDRRRRVRETNAEMDEERRKRYAREDQERQRHKTPRAGTPEAARWAESIALKWRHECRKLGIGD